MKWGALVSTLLAAGGISAYEFLSTEEGARTSSSTPRFSTRSTSPTTSSPNVPLAVRDLNSQINSYRNDLAVFANGQIDKSNFLPESDLYRKFATNAENLRAALNSYQIPNTEIEGQAKRLDQLTVSSLMHYTWESEWLQLDINGEYFKRDDVANPRHPAKVVLGQLDLEINPDDDYKQNAGKTYTNLENETDLTPSNRPKFKTLYEALDSESRAKLKQMLESYNPQIDSQIDYKQIGEEDIGIVGFNQLLSRLSDSNLEDVKMGISNGLRRNSDIGRISNRVNTQLSMRTKNANCDWPELAGIVLSVKS